MEDEAVHDDGLLGMELWLRVHVRSTGYSKMVLEKASDISEGVRYPYSVTWSCCDQRQDALVRRNGWQKKSNMHVDLDLFFGTTARS